MREERVTGVIVIHRAEGRPFTDKQIALVRTFADQAGIAIENVRLFNELQERTQELTRSVAKLTALGEVGQAVSSSLEETVLSTIIARAILLAGAPAARCGNTTKSPKNSGSGSPRAWGRPSGSPPRHEGPKGRGRARAARRHVPARPDPGHHAGRARTTVACAMRSSRPGRLGEERGRTGIDLHVHAADRWSPSPFIAPRPASAGHTFPMPRNSAKPAYERCVARWPIIRQPLRTGCSDGVSAVTTPSERIAMMWELAESAWRLAARRCRPTARLSCRRTWAGDRAGEASRARCDR
jgi:hypothetical protein